MVPTSGRASDLRAVGRLRSDGTSAITRAMDGESTVNGGRNNSVETPRRRSGLEGFAIALGVVLVLAVFVAGLDSLDAPWLLGDEHIFIVDNAAVNGDAGAWATRIAEIFRFPPEEDLYQPIPLLMYAVEWSVSGGDPTLIRFDDLLLHAVNALLLWCVLAALLRHGAGGGRADAGGAGVGVGAGLGAASGAGYGVCGGHGPDACAGGDVRACVPSVAFGGD